MSFWNERRLEAFTRDFNAAVTIKSVQKKDEALQWHGSIKVDNVVVAEAKTPSLDDLSKALWLDFRTRMRGDKETRKKIPAALLKAADKGIPGIISRRPPGYSGKVPIGKTPKGKIAEAHEQPRG